MLIPREKLLLRKKSNVIKLRLEKKIRLSYSPNASKKTQTKMKTMMKIALEMSSQVFVFSDQLLQYLKE